MFLRNGGPDSKSPPKSQRTSWIPRDDGISALQSELSAFHATDRLHIRRFESLRAGISGLTDVTIGKLTVRAVVSGNKDGALARTYLISDVSEAQLCEIPAFNGINLKTDRITIIAENGKSKYVFAVPPLVLRALKDMASSTSESEKPVNSLLPPAIGNKEPELDMVKSRLAMASVVETSSPFDENDLRSISSEIKVVLTLTGPDKKQYYYLVIGEEEGSAYRLYMSSFPEGLSPSEPQHYLAVHRLRYKDRDLLLCREM